MGLGFFLVCFGHYDSLRIPSWMSTRNATVLLGHCSLSAGAPEQGCQSLLSGSLHGAGRLASPRLNSGRCTYGKCSQVSALSNRGTA